MIPDSLQILWPLVHSCRWEFNSLIYFLAIWPRWLAILIKIWLKKDFQTSIQNEGCATVTSQFLVSDPLCTLVMIIYIFQIFCVAIVMYEYIEIFIYKFLWIDNLWIGKPPHPPTPILWAKQHNQLTMHYFYSNYYNVAY